MMPNETPDFRRAMELCLQARNETLPPAEARWLESWLAAHPEAAAEATAQEGFLDRLTAARVAVRPEFREALVRRLAGLARTEEAARRAAEPRPHGLLVRVGLFLFGRDRGEAGPSLGTLVFGRGLALYLGICLAFCLWLWAEPEPSPSEGQGPRHGETALERVLPRDRDGAVRNPAEDSSSRPVRGR